MKISDLFKGDDQDRHIETRVNMLRFRDLVYAECRYDKQAARAATALMHSLFGCLLGYPACCVLEFCEYSFENAVPEEFTTALDGHVMCRKCRREEVESQIKGDANDGTL